MKNKQKRNRNKHWIDDLKYVFIRGDGSWMMERCIHKFTYISFFAVNIYKHFFFFWWIDFLHPCALFNGMNCVSFAWFIVWFVNYYVNCVILYWTLIIHIFSTYNCNFILLYSIELVITHKTRSNKSMFAYLQMLC